MHPGSKNRLMPRHAALFPEETLLHRVARVVCGAGCLPRKELFEAWEVARRVRRRVRGGRVVDMACGHGLLAHLMLVLDDTSPLAVAFDVRLPKSAPILHAAFERAWPRIAGRVSLVEAPPELRAGDVVVSCHACGALTDDVLAAALAHRAAVAVLPCCHDAATCDTGGLAGWMDSALAIDATRAARLKAAGYAVSTQAIPAAVTPKNRLLVGVPRCA